MFHFERKGPWTSPGRRLAWSDLGFKISERLLRTDCDAIRVWKGQYGNKEACQEVRNDGP